MAIGGVYAYLFFVKSSATQKIRTVLFTVWCQLLLLALLLLLAVTGYYFKLFNNEIYAILLGYQVCNLALNPRPIFNLENKVLSYLGKISYGLYMFHPLAIVCAIRLCQLFQFTDGYLLYPLAVIIAIAISAVSYRFFEKYFISKKTSYSAIVSGDNAK
jgi:peptidoglycan/LPS O-acetylase OafA/YrhL